MPPRPPSLSFDARRANALRRAVDELRSALEQLIRVHTQDEPAVLEARRAMHVADNSIAEADRYPHPAEDGDDRS